MFAQTAKGSSRKNVTVNDCGVKAYVSTGDALLDFFSKSGALRGNDTEAVKLFSRAYVTPDDNARNLAVASLLYTRDPRNGLGERQTFRACLKYIAENSSGPLVDKVVSLIPAIGRWDDLFILFGTKYEVTALDLVRTQFDKDMAILRSKKKVKDISLLAKWLPSENASSEKTRANAKKIIKHLGISPKQYRKNLTALRKHLNVVESLMSRNKWNEITYESVPSKANLNYRNAFLKHDEERRRTFLASLSKGETKINAKTLYPYEIIHKALTSPDDTINALWDSLPDYVASGNEILIMADTSGSMHSFTGKVKASYAPIHISVSLAIYFAQRNQGAYNNMFLNFDTKPTFQYILGSNIQEIARNAFNAPWCGSTNLKAAFELVLNHAKNYNIRNEDMPKALVVVSDMQMNDGGHVSLETLKKKFAEAGYTMPKLVWWNVNASESNPDYAQEGVVFVSGASATVFRNLINTLNNKTINPLDHVIETLEPYVKMLTTNG